MNSPQSSYALILKDCECGNDTCWIKTGSIGEIFYHLEHRAFGIGKINSTPSDQQAALRSVTYINVPGPSKLFELLK